TMRAWACGERTNCACVIPWSAMSSVYRPLPVMNRLSSLRRTRAPIPSLAIIITSPEPSIVLPSARDSSDPARRSPQLHPGGARLDRLHDVVVAGAAADVALELVADRVLVEALAEPVHHVDRGHDHARRAEAALEAVVLVESLLHRMQRAV